MSKFSFQKICLNFFLKDSDFCLYTILSVLNKQLFLNSPSPSLTLSSSTLTLSSLTLPPLYRKEKESEGGESEGGFILGRGGREGKGRSERK